jgi:hypothetical protein
MFFILGGYYTIDAFDALKASEIYTLSVGKLTSWSLILHHFFEFQILNFQRINLFEHMSQNVILPGSLTFFLS